MHICMIYNIYIIIYYINHDLNKFIFISIYFSQGLAKVTEATVVILNRKEFSLENQVLKIARRTGEIGLPRSSLDSMTHRATLQNA